MSSMGTLQAAVGSGKHVGASPVRLLDATMSWYRLVRCRRKQVRGLMVVDRARRLLARHRLKDGCKRWRPEGSGSVPKGSKRDFQCWHCKGKVAGGTWNCHHLAQCWQPDDDVDEQFCKIAEAS